MNCDTREAPAVPGEGHCDWCRHPYREAVLRLPRQRVALAATARFLGLKTRTVADWAARAGERGCLPPLSCPSCPTPTPQGGACAAEGCQRKARRRNQANHKARVKAGLAPLTAGGGNPPRQVPAGVVLPVWPVDVPPPGREVLTSEWQRARRPGALPRPARRKPEAPDLAWVPPRRFPIGSLQVRL